MFEGRIVIILLPLAFSSCSQHAGDDNSSSLAKKQVQVTERGGSVMPFDINRTMHHFRKSPSGGVQQVLSTDGDAQQVALIRQHLKRESERFQQGNFSDSSGIHGTDMPGLKAIIAGANQIEIRYSEMPEGAQIAYATADPTLVVAIHSWFDAQVREHGYHAMPM